MQKVKNYTADVNVQTVSNHQAFEYGKPESKAADLFKLPTTKQEMTDYVGELLSRVKDTPLPAFMECAIGDDVEHFRAVEDFLSSNETDDEIVMLLSHDELWGCDM